MVKKIKHNTINFVRDVGINTLNIISMMGYCMLLFLDVVYHSKAIFEKRREILKQMYNAGVKTFIVVSIVALFTGMVLALQTGLELKPYQQQALVGNIIISTLTREMAPFVTAIILIAAVGSTMAAEIGTMAVSEEIDALEMMAISPVKFLVMPRVIALAIMLPIATIYTNLLGSIGGGIVAFFQLNVSFEVYYTHILDSLHFRATYVGLFKALVFGMIVSTVSCANGLRATNGALGVGRATRNSVVSSFLMVLIVGYYITAIFYGK